MDTNTKIVIGSVIATILIIVGASVLLTRPSTTETVPTIVPPEQVIRTSEYNTKGAENPTVTIVEFSDFECPACASLAPVLSAAVEDNPNLQVVYRHFPLPSHPLARPAALAVEAAGKQGQFWPMHDLIFANQADLTADSFTEFAQQLELDIDQFNQDRESEELKQIVQQDLQAVSQLQLTSTPTFFVNGIRYQGAVDLPTLQQIVAQAEQLSPAFDGTASFDGTNAMQPATGSAQPSTEEATPAAQ